MQKNDGKIDNKVVSINQKGKREEYVINNDEAVLFINGEPIYLDSFILAGNDINENRVVLTYNTSLDEVVVYKEILNVTIQQRLLEKLQEN